MEKTTKTKTTKPIINFTNENVYVVSDTHFRHTKLCYGEEVHFDRTRKYKFADEMDADIIAQWNKTIGDNDIVIFMGDFLMHCPVKQTEEIFHKYYDVLNKGKKMYWVIGNHDHLLRKKIGWDNLNMCNKMQFKKDNRLYVLQHNDFVEVQRNMPDCEYDKNLVFVHGHTHSDQKLSRFQYNDMNLVQNCVCWDAWYRPVNVNELEGCV